MNNEIVRRTLAQRAAKAGKPFFAKMRIDRIHHRHFLIHDQVGVVGHTIGDGVLTFKKIQLMVVDADIVNIVGKVHGKYLAIVLMFRNSIHQICCLAKQNI